MSVPDRAPMPAILSVNMARLRSLRLSGLSKLYELSDDVEARDDRFVSVASEARAAITSVIES